jgi:hypothetical protein
VRYVPQARQRARSLTLLVRDSFIPLFRDQFEEVTVLGYGAPPDPRQFPAWLPVMCLPHVLGIQTAEDIPLPPYLHPTEAFRPLPGAFKVGIRWAGQPGNAHDLMRSTHLSQWAPVLSVHGATFYSFRFESAAARARRAGGRRDCGSGPGTWQLEPDGRGAGADGLVIAVDSSLAHLAGALGLPVWIPLMAAVEWRWGLESPTTPWYPSARLFRQRRVGEWPAVFQEIAMALEQLVLERAHRSA